MNLDTETRFFVDRSPRAPLAELYIWRKIEDPSHHLYTITRMFEDGLYGRVGTTIEDIVAESSVKGMMSRNFMRDEFYSMFPGVGAYATEWCRWLDGQENWSSMGTVITYRFWKTERADTFARRVNGFIEALIGKARSGI